jgi:hypothetical protein
MGMLFAASYYPNPSKQNSTEHSDASAQNGDAGKSVTLDGTETGQRHEQQESKSEFWSAKLSDWALVAFTGLLVLFTYRLWKSTDKLWDAGEKQLSATQRPWVKIDSISLISDLIFENGEGKIALQVVVSNKGKSPGLRVRVDTKLVASNQISLLDEQQSFAAGHRIPPTPSELRPELTSWPEGDTIVFQAIAWLSSVDMPRFKPLADNTPSPITLLSVVGCVTYEFSFAPGYHQTGIIYALRKTIPYPGIENPVPGAVRLNGIIPKDQLQINIGFEGTGTVD